MVKDNYNGKNRAKILEIGSYPPPHTGWGVRIKYVVEQLRREGCICKVLNIGQNRCVKNPEYITVKSGFDYILKIVSYLLKGYIIHMHANGDSPKGFVLTIIALILSKCFNKKAVLTFHAGPNQAFFPQKNSKLLCPIFFLIFSLADKIICNNEEVKRAIKEYKIKSKKIYVIPAFSKHYLHYRKVKHYQDLLDFLKNHSPIVLTYILYRSEFYHESVLKAIRILKQKFLNIGLVIVGGMPEECDGGENIYQKVYELEIKENIFFAGNVSHDRFLTMLEDSDIFLRSHSRDGVCSSILEAMSLGIPVVANRDNTRPSGVIQYLINDEDDIAEKLENVINNLSQLKKNIGSDIADDTVQIEVDLLRSYA